MHSWLVDCILCRQNSLRLNVFQPKGAALIFKMYKCWMQKVNVFVDVPWKHLYLDLKSLLKPLNIWVLFSPFSLCSPIIRLDSKSPFIWCWPNVYHQNSFWPKDRKLFYKMCKCWMSVWMTHRNTHLLFSNFAFFHFL